MNNVSSIPSGSQFSKRSFALNLLGPLMFVLVLAGCSSTNKVADEQLVASSIKDARTAIRQAEQRGAQSNAPVELRSAIQKMEAADLALKRGDRESALLLAAEAEVDAELAEITALSTKSQKAVAEIRESIKMMREEIKRAQGN